MPPNYKKSQSQQYALKKKVKATVQSKINKAKAKTTCAPVPQLVKAATVPKNRQQVLTAPKAVSAAPTTAALKLPSGFRAKISYKGGVKVTADIRYETEKTDPLVKIINVGPKGQPVHREFVGPAKVEKWFDDAGNEIPKVEVSQAQVMPDGTTKPVKVEKTKEIKVEPVAAEVPQDFLPYSYLEVWGETDSDTDALREMGADLMKSGKVGGIKEFSHGYGKMYVGFLRPIMSKDGAKFGVEIMLAENRRHRRRWMLAESNGAGNKPKANAPSVPTLF